MIHNELEYEITKEEAEKFEDAIRRLEAGEESHINITPRIRQAEIDGMKSIAEELREDMAEYEELRAGKLRTFRVKSLEDLPKALIKARIATGLTQKDLAQRLGLRERQVRRYEADDYEGVRFERLRQVAAVLGVRCQGMALKI